MKKSEAMKAKRRLRVALYARVSTQEQTKGQYPSCMTQIEELEAFAKERGWEITERIVDEGCRAGTLNRSGLARLRHLVATGQIEVVACTWYNRLIGSREFYVLDKEFKTNNVQLSTIHDPTDRNSAAGRLMESMLVTIKTFENEQIGEKVRTKMRMRAEKGMWNGGLVPFGFQRHPETHILTPNPEKILLVQQMFRFYVDTRSDFQLRDWLRLHQIPAPNGNSVWSVSTLRDLLTNRRYIAEIEINKQNREREDVPESEAYRIVRAPHEPLVPVEHFEQAQVIRLEKARESPNRGGKPKSYSRNQGGRVYPLQGRFYCATCGHAMTPFYTQHRPNRKEKRRSASRTHYYICANQHKNRRKVSGHANRVLARKAEAQILLGIWKLAMTEAVIEGALDGAVHRLETELSPEREALRLTNEALRGVDEQIQNFMKTIGQGKATEALLTLMNEQVAVLTQQREQLKRQQQEQIAALELLQHRPDASALREILMSFSELAEEAEPEELQRLMRLLFNRIDWQEDGSFWVEIHHIPKSRHDSQESHLDKWFVTNVWSGCPLHRTYEPLFLRLRYLMDGISRLVSASVLSGSGNPA